MHIRMRAAEDVEILIGIIPAEFGVAHASVRTQAGGLSSFIINVGVARAPVKPLADLAFCIDIDLLLEIPADAAM